MVVRHLQKDKGHEEDAEHVDEVASIPEEIVLSTRCQSVAREYKTEVEDHDCLEEGIDEPSPEDCRAKAPVLHAKSVVNRVVVKLFLWELPVEQCIPLNWQAREVHIVQLVDPRLVERLA